mmetsp:Transcript_40432/g.125833  ORF Transcript_40432/g.125833 Transcript_40432/m.125833 type:complete len:381 (+) Transcript_40432:51-1193(+)
MESQNETPGDAVSAPESPPQQVKALNRDILGTVASLLSEGSILSDAGRFSSKATARRVAAPQEQQRTQAMSKREHEAARRRREHSEKHRLLQAVRTDDEKRIQERLERNRQAREAKFESLMDGIYKDDSFRVEASDIIQEREAELAARRLRLHQGWEAAAAQTAVLSASRPAGAQTARGSSAAPTPAGGEPPRGEPRAPLSARVAVHPGARDLRQRLAEERFHRAACLALAPSPRGEQREGEQRRQMAEVTAAARGRSRVMLEAEAWGPADRLASPHGHLSRTRPGSSSVHTARRLGAGAHGIDESDSVPAAGKTRTRFQRNLLGMLEGSLAREGEAVRYKTAHGGSCGAPCQDHFLYEQGNAIVDAEFPSGKRTYHHLL